jgi:hypothetical protein
MNNIQQDVEDIETTWKERTYQQQTGCGNLYVIVAYKHDTESKNKIEFIRVAGDGNNDCGESMWEAIADQTTFALRRARNEWEIKQIIKNLRHHRCNRFIAGRSKSCADAIGSVLEKELNL